MVRKISGKSKSATYYHLNYNFNNANETASTKQDIADTWHQNFVQITQPAIIQRNFRNRRNNRKRLS